MPIDAYIKHLETQLPGVDAKLGRAKAANDARRPADEARALEEWSQSRIRHKDL